MECVELAPAFEPRHTSDSGSKLHALHTLRETRPPLSSVCAICSVSPENLRKKTRFAPILFSAPSYTQTITRRAEDRRALPAVTDRFTPSGRLPLLFFRLEFRLEPPRPWPNPRGAGILLSSCARSDVLVVFLAGYPPCGKDV